MTKSLMMRLKVVVSSAPVAARLRKLRTFSGADSGNISITILPASVCSVTHCWAIFSTDAPSNGSDLFATNSAGLAFFFGGSVRVSTFFGSWAALKDIANASMHVTMHPAPHSQFLVLESLIGSCESAVGAECL